MQVQGIFLFNIYCFRTKFENRAALKIGKENPSCEVILIDSKDYFENSAAIITTLSNVNIHKNVDAKLKLIIKHEKYLPSNVNFIKAVVKGITPTKVFLPNDTIYYDYVIIATGTSYNNCIKSPINTSSGKRDTFDSNFGEIEAAENILIVGGGLVGVELAAEIICFYPNKQIILATSSNRILERMNLEISQLVQKRLIQSGIKIFLNEHVKMNEKEPDLYQLSNSNISIKAQKVFWCTGLIPNNTILQKNFGEVISKNGFIKVNKFLQLENYKNIFVIGDLADLEEEKMAANAITHASYVSKQIKLLLKGDTLVKPYKQAQKTSLISISLGPNDAILCRKNKLSSQGRLAVSVNKWTYKTLMIHETKKSHNQLSTSYSHIKTRVNFNSSEFLNANNKSVSILGFFPDVGLLIRLLNHFGVKVHIALDDQVQKSESENLFGNLASVYTHFVNKKIPQTFATPFEEAKILVIPVPYNLKFLDYLESLKPVFKDKFKKGILTRILLLHAGYLFENSNKEFKLNQFFTQIEESVRNIDPGIKIISLRYGPTFELLSLVAEHVKKNINMPLPLPTQGIPFIASQDVLDSIVSILAAPSNFDGNIYNVCGQTRITSEKISTIISQAVDCTVTFTEVKSEELVGQFSRLAGKMAPHLIEWWSKPKFLTKVTNDYYEITGREPMDFEAWSKLNSHIWI